MTVTVTPKTKTATATATSHTTSTKLPTHDANSNIKYKDQQCLNDEKPSKNTDTPKYFRRKNLVTFTSVNFTTFPWKTFFGKKSKSMPLQTIHTEDNEIIIMVSLFDLDELFWGRSSRNLLKSKYQSEFHAFLRLGTNR